MYSNINHCFTAAGQLEARAELLDKIANTLAVTDPASFEHCKQWSVAGNNARRALRGKGADKAIAKVEAACNAVHAVRYGCTATLAAAMGGQLFLTEEAESEAGAAADVVAELVKHTDASNEESKGEFCEA